MIVRRVIVVPLLTMTDVSTTCVEVIFRVIFRIYQKQQLPLPSNSAPLEHAPGAKSLVCIGLYTHQTSVFKDCLRAATVCNREVSRPIFSSPGIPSGSKFKKDDPRLKTFPTQLETNLSQCVHFSPLKLYIYRSL